MNSAYSLSTPWEVSWEYLAGWFDINRFVYEKRTSTGLEARLRFSSYDKAFLEKISNLLGAGRITAEPRDRGLYYRMTITGCHRVDGILTRLLPHLRRKREEVKRWLTLHKVKAEIGGLKRRLRMKPRKYLRAETRQLTRAIYQLTPPPLRVTD